MIKPKTSMALSVVIFFLDLTVTLLMMSGSISSYFAICSLLDHGLMVSNTDDLGYTMMLIF